MRERVKIVDEAAIAVLGHIFAVDVMVSLIGNRLTIVGPQAVGKTRVARHILKKHPTLEIYTGQLGDSLVRERP